MLFLFNLFFVGSYSLRFSGWAGILFIFSTCLITFSSLLSSRGCSPVACSMAAMGVDLIPPVMRRMLAFWTLLSLSVLVFAAVVHADEEYSRWGLTVLV